jgi:diguanylate cyclase (GGDEF)-like protein
VGDTRTPAFRELPARARLFVVASCGVALAVVAAFSALEPDRGDAGSTTLAAVGIVCLAASLSEVFAPGHYSLQPNLIPFTWGALLLPPWALPILAALCCAPAVFARRVRWYKHAFNLGDYMLAGAVGQLVATSAGVSGAGEDLGLTAVAGLAGGAAVLVACNYALLGIMINLAHHRPLRRVFLTLAPGFPLDLAMALTGACLLVLWTDAPALALLAAGPILLVMGAMRVPDLEHRSRTDPKTGLFNVAHFRQELGDALEAARRRGLPVSLIMVDLDHLRVVNNRFGHLTGDRVIAAFGSLLAEAAADTGLAARFGGEEFCLLLPGISAAEARARADVLRARFAALPIEVGDGQQAFCATASFGVASFPAHGDVPEALLEAADAALYDAKLGGRDRVRNAVSPATRATLNLPPMDDRAAAERVTVVKHMITPSAGLGAATRDAPAPAPAPGAPQQPPAGGATAGLVPAFVGLLAIGAGAMAAWSSTDAIARMPVILGLLVASVVILDRLSIDLFDRGNISPGSVPTLALAFLFGPLGPLMSELVVALVRVVRREPLVRVAFDVGALGLAGGAAALAFTLQNGSTGGVLAAAIAGGAVYYAVNVSLLAVVMGLTEGRSPLDVWRERLAWLFPQYLVFGLLGAGVVMTEAAVGPWSLVIFGAPVVMLLVVERQYVNRSRTSVQALRESHDELALANAQLRDLLANNEDLLRGMHRSYLSTITSLARTIEAKDPYTGGHTERVAQFACLLAVELGMDSEELAAVEVGGVIHDIGKIGIPDAVLLKPGRLTDEEFAEMRRHPEISSYILADLELPAIVKQMARSHHERYDGCGYPDGLAAKEIPLAARILTVADALDAMTSDRPYRDALPLAVAVEEIESKGGTQFCPEVIGALRDCLSRDPTLGGQYDEHEPANGRLAATSGSR